VNSRLIPGICATAVLVAAFVGCQTTPDAAPVASAIQADRAGFAPRGDAEHSSITFSLLFGNKEAIKGWKVEVVGAVGAEKVWSGDKTQMPATLSWDGTIDGGAPAPEGAYVARLSIDYGKTYRQFTQETANFILDVTPPTGRIAVEPKQFVPADPGVSAPLTFSITASGGVAKIDEWSLDIYDETGALFRSFAGKWPAAKASWDGSSTNGAFVAPATIYKAVATVRDEYGNSAELKADVPVADVPPPIEESLVRARSSGFSPKSDTQARAMDLLLTFGDLDDLKSWKLSVAQADGDAQKNWSGNEEHLPQSIPWDGKTDGGDAAAEGRYTAALSVDYGRSFKPVHVQSEPFILALTPPAGAVAAEPARLTPDGKGGITPVAFKIDASSPLAKIEGWSLSILGSDGNAVAKFEGVWPAAEATWDGRLAGGGRADPGMAFTYVAHVRDEYGNVGEIRGSLGSGELPAVQGQAGIRPLAGGFAPTGGGAAASITLALSYGQPAAVKSWKVSISGPGLDAQKTYTGDSPNLPATLSWDGRTDGGTMAPEGTYQAALSIDYGSVFSPASGQSEPFVLDVTPPAGSIRLSPPLFSPVEGSDTIVLTVDASSPVAKIDDWTMDIYDQGGDLFKTFSGKWPTNQATWDGKGIHGEMVQPAEDYAAVAHVRDEFGNVGEVKAIVPIGILAEKTATGYLIPSSHIYFKAFTVDFKNVFPRLARQNLARLDALAAMLKKFPGYLIRIIGHAVMMHWDDPAKGRAEQRVVLVPLSRARAEAVRKALLERGLDASRVTTEGVGASIQLVPDSDLEGRWQNSRVDLFLEKQ
jgi:flagellar hook assembly protein FlgD